MKEEFLNKKRETTRDMDSTSVLEDTFQCEHCANSFKIENRLKIHIGKSHKALKPNLSPEKVREHLQDTPVVLHLRDVYVLVFFCIGASISIG